MSLMTAAFSNHTLCLTCRSIFISHGHLKCMSHGTKSLSSRKGDSGGFLDISLRGDEVSDVLNFVLKDAVTGRWSDNNGSNFAMGLKPAKESAIVIPDVPSVHPSLSDFPHPFNRSCVISGPTSNGRSVDVPTDPQSVPTPYHLTAFPIGRC